jgi:DNA-binding SARP family transcriptional activator
MLKIHLLGSFEIKCRDEIINISSRPAQSLFAYLILNSSIFHRREKLAAMLWPDTPDINARENLRHALWRIRKALPVDPKAEYLFTDDFAIAFNASAEYWLDVTVLKTAAQCKCADDLISALSVYQGELLPGFYEEWVTLEREYLNSVFEHNMARLMAILQTEHRWLDILDWGERWLAFGGRPEPAYRALMLAHKAEGEISKVADTYARCVRSLAEIGLEPSEQTRELYDNLKTGNLQTS